VVIDVFTTNDFMCLVKALKDWKKDKVVQLSTQKPMFRLAEGQNYTGALFNKDLRSLLENEVDYEKSSITTHSFRQAWVRRRGDHEDWQVAQRRLQGVHRHPEGGTGEAGGQGGGVHAARLRTWVVRYGFAYRIIN
jgi:hypothetical protein